MPRTRGTVVASAPQRNSPMPCVLRPLTNPGPAEMPTIAMKMLRPTEFMNHTVGVGMRPNFGRTERDLAQEHAARRWKLSELGERLAVDRLVRHQDVHALDGHRKQLLVLHFGRIL